MNLTNQVMTFQLGKSVNEKKSVSFIAIIL